MKMVSVTIFEGSKWHLIPESTFYHVQNQLDYNFFAAVRIGKYIYDFKLAALGLNPIRIY